MAEQMAMISANNGVNGVSMVESFR